MTKGGGMKINIPKLIREIKCSDYAPEVDYVFQVWVNPPTQTLQDLGEIYKKYVEDEKAFDDFLNIISELLSQGKDKWPVDELKQMIEGTQDTDPGFWSWLQTEIVKIISEHRTHLKKD